MPGCLSLGSSRLVAMDYLTRSALESNRNGGRPEKAGLTEK